MNCPTGKPGTPAYAMSAEESLSNMARLSLCGKLNLAIEKCNLCRMVLCSAKRVLIRYAASSVKNLMYVWRKQKAA